MKTDKNIKITSWIIIGLAILFVGLTYFAFWIEGFTAIYILLIAGLVGLVLIGLIGRRIVTVFITKNYRILTPSIIGIVAILFVIFRPVERMIEGLKSPIVLVGTCEHTVTQLSITLRKDMTFEYNAGGFLTTIMYYGNYQTNGDTITLKFDKPPKEDLKEKLVLSDNALTEIGDTTQHRHYFKLLTNKLY